jgi:hypothetical protein
MAETEVLHQEPRYKIAQWVDEILGRWELVERDLHGELKQLLEVLAAEVVKLTEVNTDLTGRIGSIEWLKGSGKLLIRLSKERVASTPRERHQVDDWVDAAVAAWKDAVPELIRRELAEFIRGVVTQLALITKHNPSITLRGITFERPHAWGEDCVIIGILHAKRPLLPHDARLH